MTEPPRSPLWSRISPALTVARDLASFGIGGWGLVHQALQPTPNTGVLMVFAGLLVAPGLLAAHWLATSGIGGPSSTPPSPQPPSGAQPPSPTGSG